MTKVSVVVPVYNVEKYLNRCIDSILNQTFRDFELILVDDGSTDQSGRICDEYKEKDNRIVVIHKTNGGLSDARNYGIDRAKGEYITFIDSDDWIKERYIEVLYNNAVKFKVDISAVNLHKEYDDRSERSCDITEGVFDGKAAMQFLYGDISIYLNVACAKLYKIDLFEDIRYPVGKLHEDGFTTYKLLYFSNTVYFSNEDLYSYYQRQGSIMNKFSVSRFDEYEVYIERKKFFEEHNLEGLARANEKTRLSCIKSLTVKMYENDLDKKTRSKWLNIFKQDIKQNISRMSRGGRINSFFDKIYLFSPQIFYRLVKAKDVLRCLRKKKREFKIMLWFYMRVLYAKLFFKNRFAFLMLTPIGGNLGDQALTLAEERLLKKIYLVEMPCPHFPIYFNHINSIKRLISNHTIIFNAGGNVGTLWYESTEYYFRKVIEEFPDNNIVVLPNTCFYEKSEWGKEELDKSIALYNNHNHLTIFAREETSYSLMKGIYQNIYLMPDMVMYLKYNKPATSRSGAVICLRDDCEKTLNETFAETLIEKMQEIYGQIVITDTVIPGIVTKRKRKKYIEKKLDQFSTAKIVVTDRLHGMVFAAITATPCIVLNSMSHKLEGCYKWIKDLEYVKFIDNIPEIENFCKNIVERRYEYHNENLLKYYDELRDFIYKIVEDSENA